MDAHVGKYVTCMACDVATSAPAAASALIIVKQQQQQDEENTQAEKQSRAEQSRAEQARTEQTELSRNVVAILAVRWPATTMIVEWKST